MATSLSVSWSAVPSTGTRGCPGPGDPASRINGSIFAQTLPFVDPAAFQMYVDFELALYASR